MAAGFAYRGKVGEAYSPFNHFISELGEVGVSRLAWAFNIGLILSGISLVGASISLGMILLGVLAKFGMIFAIICSISLVFVGLYPMNRIEPHGRAAMTYFRSGLLMMICFTLAVALQPSTTAVLPRGFSVAGLPAILSFASFLVLIGRSSRENEDDPLDVDEKARPRIRLIAIVEWSIFLTILLWFVVIAIGL